MGWGPISSNDSETSVEQRIQIQRLDLTMLRKDTFLVLFVIAFVYNGVAWSLVGWIALFNATVSGLFDILIYIHDLNFLCRIDKWTFYLCGIC